MGIAFEGLSPCMRGHNTREATCEVVPTLVSNKRELSSLLRIALTRKHGTCCMGIAFEGLSPCTRQHNTREATCEVVLTSVS